MPERNSREIRSPCRNRGGLAGAPCATTLRSLRGSLHEASMIPFLPGSALDTPPPGCNVGGRRDSRMADAHLLLDRVSVRGRERPILDRLSFSLARGQTLALLGPEGAGKTATLLLLAGFLRPSLGTVKLAGRDIT